MLKKQLILINIVLSVLFFWISAFADTESSNIISGVAEWSIVDTGATKWKDLYYIMNSANLNTMNSYIIPVKNDIDPTNYEELKYRLVKDPNSFRWYTLKTDYKGSFKDNITQWLRLHIMSTYPAIIFMFIFIFLLRYFGVKKTNTFFSQVFHMVYEMIWTFFADVVWEKQPRWIKHFVVSLFSIILLANLFGLVNDFIRFVMPQWLRRVTAPTGEFEFNIALAIIATVVTLYYQWTLVWGPHKLIHEYIPITGKWVMDGTGFMAKLWDIIVSLFMWLLDIIGLFAKIISLSLRLFWNMSSGSILLNVIFIGLSWVTVWLIGVNLQIWLPIAIYLQWILAAVIQAFVFALLVSMWIRLLNE